MAEATAVSARRFLPRIDPAPLRNRGFRLLFSAEAISVFGDAFHAVALPWLIYQLGGGARELGLIVGAYGVLRLAGTPLGGMLADRVGPRTVMFAADTGRAVLTAAIVVLAAADRPSFVLLGVLVAGVGLGTGLFQPAAYAITPTLLPAEQLRAGNALHSAAAFGAGLAGPALAGVLVATLSPAVAFGIDAATFLVSAACLFGIRSATPVSSSADAPRATIWTVLRSSRLLRTVLVVTAIANLTVAGLVRVGLPEFATDLGGGASTLGWLLAAFTAGSLAGGLFSTGLTTVDHLGRTAMLSGLVMAGMLAVIPFVGHAGALAALAVAGVGSSVTNIMIITLVQQDTARHLLGRVMSLIMLAALGLFPLSTIIAGFVAEAANVTVLFLATGVTLSAAFLFGLSRREMRDR
ncbi:MFS transporter [Catenuloplanes japonicus]|uniref:MFS transporter n=1 Tax=Catenuloplanes japonicus TaxID=33876 RepID=UPI000527ADBF|nr:MFS transporter [Catenuloplanes japonicus]